MKTKPHLIPSADKIKAALHYNPETGEFRWTRNLRGPVKAGDIAGCIKPNGYRYIKIGGRAILAHRLAWKITTGADPIAEIDHINGVRDDNRKSNLRNASSSENRRNMKKPRHNTSGTKGVTWDKSRGRWAAQINVDGKHIYLGVFRKITAAAAAYAEASKRLHGEFGRVA